MKRQWILSQGLHSPLGSILLSATLEKTTSLLSTPNRVLQGIYSISFILKGEGFYKDEEGRRLSVKEGDIIWAYPDIPHTYGPTNPQKPWDEFFVLFKGALFDLSFQTDLFPWRERITHQQLSEKWVPRIQSILKQKTSHTLISQTEKILSFYHQLIYLAHSCKKDASPDAIFLKKARGFLAPSSIQYPKLLSCAESLQMNYHLFRKKFSQLSGESPQKYQSRLRLESVANELIQTKNPLWKIAEKMGYYDEYHLSKQFTKFYQMSPKSFRKKFNSLGTHHNDLS